MTRSCENAPVHSELFAHSTLKTMGTGNATDAAGTSSTVRRDCPFPTRSGTVRLDDLSLLIPSTIELDHFLLVAEVSARPHTDQLTRVTTHVPVRFRSIHRWLPKACLQVESSADENVVT